MDRILDALKKNSRMMLLAAAALYALKKYADLRACHHTVTYQLTPAQREEQPMKEIYPNYFKNKSGLWLHVRRWHPHASSNYTTLPRGVVFLVHGYAEHIGRYEHIAERLARLGYYVCGIDHQGHGMSDGDRAHVERFEHFVQDYLAFMAFEQANLLAEWQTRNASTQFEPITNPPCFILGHSMGGLIAYFLALAIQGGESVLSDESLFRKSPPPEEAKELPLSPVPPSHNVALAASPLGSTAGVNTPYTPAQLQRASSISPTNPQGILAATKGLWPIRGVIFSSPAFAIDPVQASALVQFIAGLFSTLTPKLPMAPLDADGVSSIPQVVARYKADPLNYTGFIRARLGHEFASAIKRARSSFAKFTLPFLIIHGERDTICPPSGSRELFANASSQDKELKIYNKSQHEVFLDVDASRAILDVTTWLRDRSE